MNIVICDDDKNLSRDFLNKLKPIINLYNNKRFEFKYFCYDNPQAVLKDSKKINFDIAFIDIEMPETDGFKLGEELYQTNNDIFIFYVTSYRSFAIPSIKHRVYRFIIKGDTDELMQGIKHMLDDIVTLNSRYCFTFKTIAYSIPFKSIAYCESRRNKMIIHTDKDVYEQTITLKLMLSKFPYFFCRCHSGYIVNVLKVKEVKSTDIVLDNNTIIPISRKYKAEFYNKFSEILIDL